VQVQGDMLRMMRRMREEMEVLRKRAADAEARLEQRERRRPNKRRRLDPDLDARPQAPPRIPPSVSSSATGEGGEDVQEEEKDPGLFEDTDPPPASRPATTMLRLPVVSSELTLDDVNAMFDRVSFFTVSE